MPLYTFRCQQGHDTEDLRKAEDREHLMACSECGWSAQPIMSAPTAPRFAVPGVRGHTTMTSQSVTPTRPSRKE